MDDSSLPLAVFDKGSFVPDPPPPVPSQAAPVPSQAAPVPSQAAPVQGQDQALPLAVFDKGSFVPDPTQPPPAQATAPVPGQVAPAAPTQDQPPPAAPPPAPAQDQAAPAAPQPLTLDPGSLVPEETGFFSGLASGAHEDILNDVRTAAGKAFTPDPNAPPEPPRSWANQLGYGVGGSGTVIAAGLGMGGAGTAIGTAVGGPVGAAVGGIAGSALGVGAVSAAKELAPAYVEGLGKGLSPDDAEAYAWKHAAIAGGVAGATTPIFAIPSPLKSVVGKILFNAFVTQPAAGTAARVAVPAALGEKPPSMGELISGAGQDVAMGGIFSGAHALVSPEHAPPPAPRPSYGSPVDVAVRTALTPTGTERPTERVMTPSAPEPAPSPPPAPEPPAPLPAPPVAAPPAPVAGPGQSAPPPAPPDQAEPTTRASTAAPAAVPSASETPAPAPGAAAETPAVPPDTSPPPPATPPEALPPSRPEIVAPEIAPSTPSVEPVTPPPDDRPDSATRGPGTTEALGAEHPQGVQPPGEPAQAVGQPDTRGLPEDTQAPAQAPAAETAGVAPSTYTVDNPHPASIGARIDQLEQLGASRTPEQTAQLQALHQQRDAAGQASPERAAKQDQLSQLDNQITTLEAQEQKASARKNNAIQPSKALIAQRDELDALKQQRGALQSDIAAAQPIERQRYNQAVYGEPQPPVARAKAVGAPALADRTPTRGTMPEGMTPGSPGLRDANEPSPLTDQAFTTEPDHEDPNQYVAKNANGDVVAVGDTPEQALEKARNKTQQNEATGPRQLAETGPSDQVSSPGLEPTTGPGENTGPIHEVLDPNSQLGKLTTTRDKILANTKPGAIRSAQQEARLGQLNTQIAKLRRGEGLTPETPDTQRGAPIAPETLADKRGGGPIRGGRRQPFTGPPDPLKPRDFLDYKFNNGTSVLQRVYAEAGLDPNVAVNLPIARQVKILTDHMVNKFGFKSVDVVGAHGPDATPVDQHIAVEHMLDVTRAIQDGMATQGLPHIAASDGGKLSLKIIPQGQGGHFGSYEPQTGIIEVMGGANSFGHEWIHAVDHLIAERLTGDPAHMNKLLSMYGRDGVLRPHDPVDAAMAKIINTMFYDDPALAAHRLGLEVQAMKTNAAGAPTKAALEARTQLDLLDKGGSQQRIKPSAYRAQSAAFQPKKAGYWASVHEMLARAGEAAMARRMENEGKDPRGFVMPDQAYLDETDRQLRMAYPKGPERTAIFDAFDDMFNALRNEQVFSNGKPPGDFFDLGISDEHHWPITAPQASGTALGRLLRKEISGFKNFGRDLVGLKGDSKRPSPGALTWGERMKDHMRIVAYSAHGIMESVIARAPEEAKPYLTAIMDRLATAPGEGRYTPENFEEAVRYRSRGWTRRFANILKNNGLDPDTMTDEENQMLRHVMTTTNEPLRYPVDPLNPLGRTKPVSDNIKNAAGPLRKLMNEAWAESRQAGLDIGYAKNGYFPRLYDMAKIFSDKLGFTAASNKLHDFMFDKEVGDPGANPEALSEKWTTLSKEDRDNAPGDLADNMKALSKNLARQRAIENELENPLAKTLKSPGTDPVALKAELATLKAEAATIAADNHAALRTHVSGLATDDWYRRLTGSEQADFDKTMPSANYLKARTLPPEADVYMRDYMHTDVADALPHYFHAASRRIAFAERFGANGQGLQALFQKALDAGMRPEDKIRFEKMVNTVTGRSQTGGVLDFLQPVHQALHAAAAIALMPRAVWSALAEPMNAAMATGSMKVGFKTFAYQFGSLVNKASAKERTEMAELLNVITSKMHDTVMMSRMSADYSDSPLINKLMTKFYRVTGLTQVTNAQRTASAAANNWFLAKLSRDYVNQDGDKNAKHAREDATRWFNELGLKDVNNGHARFAKWMNDLGGEIPGTRELAKDPMLGAYSLAIRRLVDRSIQDPYKVDRAVTSSLPMIGLAFQLMSFNYQFQRNVLTPIWGSIEHNAGRAYLEARAAGGGKLGSAVQGLGAGGGTAAHALGAAGAMIGASVLTTLVRQSLFAPDQMQKHMDEGDLAEYILGLGMQRTGLNGTLDPFIQVFNNMRYDTDLSSLVNGAGINWFSHNAMDLIQPFVNANDSPNTNTRAYNQARAAYNLIGVPLASTLLSVLGDAGGPITRAISSAALQYGTAPAAADAFAATVAGPKGKDLAQSQGMGELPEMQGMSDPTAGGGEGEGRADKIGGSAFAPIGLADDIAIPAARYVGPIINRMPWQAKAGAVAAGLGYGAYKYLEGTAPFREEE